MSGRACTKRQYTTKCPFVGTFKPNQPESPSGQGFGALYHPARGPASLNRSRRGGWRAERAQPGGEVSPPHAVGRSARGTRRVGTCIYPRQGLRVSLFRMPDWKALRHQFPLLDRYIYLNACSLGPLPRRGRSALERYAHDWDTKGTPVWFSDWLPLLERLRAGVGGLLNAPQGSTGIAPSVSVALTTLASGLPLPEGRNKVLIGALDFPTIGHQWLSRPEFEVEFVPSADGMTIPPEAFAERIDKRTALVATTHLFYTTGY